MAKYQKRLYFSEEKYTVKIMRDDATGTAIREMWYRLDKLDRVGGPAVIVRDPATGAVTSELWYKDGKRQKRPPADA